MGRGWLRAGYLLPVVSLVAGVVAGRLGFAPPGWASGVLLHFLIGVAGFVLGLELPSLRPLLGRGLGVGLLLAVSTVASSGLAGCFAALLLGHPARVGVVIGAASGWYSLVGPLVAGVDPGLGLVALVANQLREAVHVAVYPFLARKGLGLEAVSLGGATTMDTGLPVVAVYGGGFAAAAAVVQGLAITIAAPLLLPVLLGC